MRGKLFLGKDNLSGKKKYNNGEVSKYFFPGEEPDGWVLGSTDEKKKRNSEAQKRVWQDLEYRKQRDELYKSDEYHKKMHAAAKAGWENTDREARKKSAKLSAEKRFSNIDERQKAADRMKAKWQEADYRDSQIKALQIAHKDLYDKHPEYRTTLAASNLKAWKEHKAEILAKQYATKSKNKSFNTSKAEENYYKGLIEIYGIDDVKRQYNEDPRYPFACDFYIPSEDLFIELNAHWSHGGHPFDETNLDDIYKLEQWQEKAETSVYYKNAIIVWTERDPLKIKIAKNNNLNIKFIY